MAYYFKADFLIEQRNVIRGPSSEMLCSVVVAKLTLFSFRVRVHLLVACWALFRHRRRKL